MKQKTIRLDGGQYKLIDGTLHIWVYTNSDYSEGHWGKSSIQIGRKLTLVSSERVGLNGARPVKWSTCVGPVGGNTDSEIKRYHGWRGTTNDVSVHAHGERQITKIRTLKNRDVAVTFGCDLNPDAA